MAAMPESAELKINLHMDFTALIDAFRRVADALEGLQSALKDATVDEQ